MTAFVVLGGLGLAAVLLSLLVGDVFEGVFEALDIDAGGGLFSVPVLGSFLAAFGFGSALLVAAADAPVPLAALGGAGGGLVFGAIALALTRSLIHMNTDASVRTVDLVGKPGTVVTRIPADGLGEVVVAHLGQRLKLNARATNPVPAGAKVVVVAVTSPSSVLVELEDTFWGTSLPGGPS